MNILTMNENIDLTNILKDCQKDIDNDTLLLPM